MRIPDHILDRFIKLMEQEFGEKLTRDEALEKFERLDSVLRVIYRIKPRPDMAD